MKLGAKGKAGGGETKEERGEEKVSESDDVRKSKQTVGGVWTEDARLEL